MAAQINKKYIYGVSIITFVLPLVSAYIGSLIGSHEPLSFESIGKWFIFYAVGLRLFIAGIRQSTNPAFTAKQIFHIESTDSYPIMRELGFANLCFGLIGLISLFMPDWRIVSAFGSGIYYGLAGVLHLIKKPAGANEKYALITDFIIFILLAIYFIEMI